MTPFFIGRTHFYTTNLGIWEFFGQETYIHSRKPGLSKNIHFLIFSSKKVEIADQCSITTNSNTIQLLQLQQLSISTFFDEKKLKMNNLLISWFSGLQSEYKIGSVLKTASMVLWRIEPTRIEPKLLA